MSKLTILLVDDDPLMLRMLVPRLERLEVSPPVGKVVSAQTPQAALQEVERADVGPLAVLSDFNLKAALNGLQLLGEIQKRRPDSVRVLFSGYSDTQIGDVTGSGAAHAFLEKPLRIDELLGPLVEAIHATLGSA